MKLLKYNMMKAILTVIFFVSFTNVLYSQTKDADDLPTGAVQVTVPHSGNYDIAEADVDWYRVDLTASTEYIMSVAAAPLDTYIYLYGPGNADGTLTGDEVATDDETNAPDPVITYTPTATGYYYLRVAEYGVKKGAGAYTLSITGSAPPSGFVKVTSPNGSEEWAAGATQTVSWDYDISDLVKIDLYKNLVFVDELAITSCTGSYGWTIDPGLAAGTDYKIRITSTADSLVSDESDLFFSILDIGDGNNLTTTATVLAVPHAGDYDIYKDGDFDWYRIELEADSVYNFSVSNSTIDTHMNLYGPGNETGTSTGAEVATDDDTNGWDPSIQFNTVTSGYYYLRVSEFSYSKFSGKSKSDSKGTGTYSLTIKELDLNPPVVLTTAPAANAVNVLIDSNITVKLNEKMDATTINETSYTLFKGVTKIEGMVSYIDSIATFNPASDLEYSTIYTVTITAAVADSAGNNLASDYSWNFTTQAEPPYVKILSPNGSENLVTDSTYVITWDYNIAENVKIDLLKGLSFVDEIAITTCTGNLSWTIPSTVETGNDYKVRISSTADTLIYDLSDGNFSIVKSPFITITNPDSLGISWKKGTSKEITWDYNIFEQVKIDLYKGLVFVDEVALTSCTGSFIWTIPATVANGTDYSIKITSEMNSLVSDVSENYFEIFGTPVPVNLISPSDNDTLLTKLPTFDWSVSPDATGYEIIIDNSNLFDSPEINDSIVTNTFTALSELGYGIYYWKVRAGNAYGFSEYSIVSTFEILGPPEPPILINPAVTDTISTRTPTFEWSAVAGADVYYILVDDNVFFDSPEVNDSTTTINVTCPVSLGDQKIYYWKVCAKNIAGVGEYSGTRSFYLNTTGIEQSRIPAYTELHQNYPNPFNPETTINFDIAESGIVNVSVFNYKGELVATLVNENKNIGKYSVKWNCSNQKGQSVTSGMYIIVMTAENYSKVVKALLIK